VERVNYSAIGEGHRVFDGHRFLLSSRTHDLFRVSGPHPVSEWLGCGVRNRAATLAPSFVPREPWRSIIPHLSSKALLKSVWPCDSGHQLAEPGQLRQLWGPKRLRTRGGGGWCFWGGGGGGGGGWEGGGGGGGAGGVGGAPDHNRYEE